MSRSLEADDDMTQIRESTLNMYRAALIAMCKKNGGGCLIETRELTEPGTLMCRWEENGVRFVFHSDGEAN